MKLVMRLYRRHDLDLVNLYQMPEFNFQESVKKVLADYVSDQNREHSNFKIKVPQNSTQTPNYKELRQYVQVHVYLSDENDKDIVNWVQGIRPGFRNSIIKNIFRNYLSRPGAFPTLTEYAIEPEMAKK